jgi:hypothetical protein
MAAKITNRRKTMRVPSDEAALREHSAKCQAPFRLSSAEWNPNKPPPPLAVSPRHLVCKGGHIAISNGPDNHNSPFRALRDGGLVGISQLIDASGRWMASPPMCDEIGIEIVGAKQLLQLSSIKHGRFIDLEKLLVHNVQLAQQAGNSHRIQLGIIAPAMSKTNPSPWSTAHRQDNGTHPAHVPNLQAIPHRVMEDSSKVDCDLQQAQERTHPVHPAILSAQQETGWVKAANR